MAEKKKITDKKFQQDLMIKAGVIGAAALIAALLIPLFHKKSAKFAEDRNLKQERNLTNISRYFEECLKQADNGNYAMARKNLFKLKPAALKPNLQAKWYATMTDIYYKEARSTPKLRSFLVMNALNYAQRGLDTLPDREMVDSMSKIKAELYLLNEQWKPASEILMTLEARSTTPKARWQYRMDAALCFKNLKMDKKAIQLLNSVIDETDEQEIWAQAMRRKGDIYMHLTENKYSNNNYAFDPVKPYVEEFVSRSIEQYSNANKAEAIYQEVINEIKHDMHPDKMAALVKLLEIYVAKGQVQEAYTVANTIKRASSDRPYSASVYMNMAKMESRRGNLERAATYVERLILSHPGHPYMKIAFDAYYDKLKEHKMWDKAFELTLKIVKAPVSDKIRIKIIEDLHLGERKLLNYIDLSKKSNQKRVGYILDSVSEPEEGDKEIILFGKASLRFAVQDYYMADVLFSEYLREVGYEKFKEKAYYYYLASAVNDKKPPIIRAARAKIYLNNTFDSDRSQNVMLFLMAAYYDMGMWQESIDAAMKVFVNEIVKMGEEKDNYKASNEWLKAVARIGQSYEKIGRKADASNVFDTWAPEFKKSQYAASIYRDWAELAASNKQHHEALRRYNVIMPFVTKPDEFMELACLRTVQKLKINKEKARKEGLALVKKLPTKIELLSEDKIETLQRRIYKALLENSLEHDQKNLENLFNKILSIYKSESWPYTFMIKWLQKNIKNPEYKNINKYFQSAVSGPLSALKEDKVRKAITEQAKMLVMLENENVF